ncbi:MAG: HPr family phosphocarrier protein [Planctomycetota bacterium]|nr:HPr family phosphocarrier protein [Planctomycetota bacterium]
MGDGALEEVIPEQAFAALVQRQGDMLFRLAEALRTRGDADWTRRHFFQLVSEADAVEAFLDDFGARHNRTFAYLRELVASVRGFALAGFSIAHLAVRLDGYPSVLSTGEAASSGDSVRRTQAFLVRTVRRLLAAVEEESRTLGIRLPTDPFPEDRWMADEPRRKLARNMGQGELASDEQKTAEIASKFVEAAILFEDLGVRRIAGEHERETWLQHNCSEERARSLEATVHNLQSAYDTWVKGTAIEAGDPRLPKLRGHASAALHLLEAVTQLTHFVERHERTMRDDAIARRIAGLVSKSEVRDTTLNHMLVHAGVYLRRGRSVAEDLLPSYTNVQEIEVGLRDDVVLHARPAALIVGIVQRYGTPVEFEVDGHRCNAASILEMMVTVGSAPEARRFLFRGDERPLRDIALLFEHALGEDGLDRLPPPLAYLRSER